MTILLRLSTKVFFRNATRTAALRIGSFVFGCTGALAPSWSSRISIPASNTTFPPATLGLINLGKFT